MNTDQRPSLLYSLCRRGGMLLFCLLVATVTGLSATYDSRKDTQSYEIQLFRRVDLSVVDEVRIRYRPLSIEVDTRIVGLMGILYFDALTFADASRFFHLLP